MKESFKRNKINETNPVEVNAFFNSDFQPGSQMAKIGELDNIIEKANEKVNLDQDSQDINSVNDYNAFRKSMKLQDDLEKAINDKNTLIKEGIENFHNNNELLKGHELEDSVKMYPYLNKNESLISKLKRLTKEIERKKNYIENSDKPLSDVTLNETEDDINKIKTEIDKSIKSN